MTIFAIALLLAAAAGTSFDEVSRGAQAADRAGRADEAIGLYRKALRMKPSWADGWWGLGALEYSKNQFANCRDALAQLNALDPAAAGPWALRGICEFEVGQYAEAGEHLGRAREGAKGVSELSRKADLYYALLLIKAGGFEPAQLMLGEMATAAYEGPEVVIASGLSSLRMRALPREVPEADREMVRLAGTAFIAAAKQKPADAKAAFAALLGRFPNRPNVHYFYGVWLAQDNPDAARAEYRKEIEISPQHAPARARLALLDIDNGENETAERLAREASTFDPQYVPAWLALSRALLRANDAEAALKAGLKARDLAPDSGRTRLLLVSIYRALHRDADAEREEREFKRLSATGPSQ